MARFRAGLVAAELRARYGTYPFGAGVRAVRRVAAISAALTRPMLTMVYPTMFYPSDFCGEGTKVRRMAMWVWGRGKCSLGGTF